MAKTVLIVEDEDILREIVKDYLLNEGYNVIEAADGNEALVMFEEHPVDLIILDIMLPKLDGWSVCRRIRKTSSDVAVIMLTARADEDDTLLGFELGADDYVTKPYSPPILLARVKRLLESRNSAKGTLAEEERLTGNGICLDLASRTVSAEGETIHLTHTEFEILAYLMRNAGMIITREQLITKIWGYEFAGDDRTINSHIRNLRHKLGNRAKAIVTVIRVGYKFEGDV
ncbi:response regulator transcription factor [Alkalihalobacillus oceani]|uniref:Response regulator transcription factor n=1 Tax=Halalkalibacter oceani TaxID=1653776 RepID=A0A9X2DRK1_9BACI|nr:response regulator transcription factor [Halalkalibacter oceani]MCM3713863.1 response regulator transcription factor [Halalkalibacter oceani]